MKVKQTIEHELDIRKYDDIVAVRVNNEHWFILRRSFFDKQMKKHGDHTWIVVEGRIPREEYLVLTTKAYYDHYVSGNHYQFEGQYYIDNIPRGLSRCDRSRVVQDYLVMDGFFYGIDRKPIRRNVVAEVWSARYNIKEVVDGLSKRKDVRDISVTDTPYYNIEICGRQTLTFTYVPTQKMFMEYYKQCERNCLDADEWVRETVGLSRAEKSEPDSEDYYGEFLDEDW